VLRAALRGKQGATRPLSPDCERRRDGPRRACFGRGAGVRWRATDSRVAPASVERSTGPGARQLRDSQRPIPAVSGGLERQLGSPPAQAKGPQSPIAPRIPSSAAEGVGFEPTVDQTADNGFRDPRRFVETWLSNGDSRVSIWGARQFARQSGTEPPVPRAAGLALLHRMEVDLRKPSEKTVRWRSLGPVGRTRRDADRSARAGRSSRPAVATRRACRSRSDLAPSSVPAGVEPAFVDNSADGAPAALHHPHLDPRRPRGRDE
jgi:hypothetical protein